MCPKHLKFLSPLFPVMLFLMYRTHNEMKLETFKNSIIPCILFVSLYADHSEKIHYWFYYIPESLHIHYLVLC